MSTGSSNQWSLCSGSDPAQFGITVFRRIFSVTLLAAFLSWVLWYVSSNTEAFRPVLQATWLDALVLTLAFLAIMIGNGLFIAVVSHAFRIRLAGFEWLSLSFASSFVNYFLPFRGGTGIRALYMNRVHGFLITKFVSTLSIMYLMHTVVNGLLALAGMGLIARNGGPLNVPLMLFFALVTVAGIAAMLIRFEVRREFQKFPLAQIAKLINAWQVVRADRALVTKLWVLMFAMALATVWQCRAAFDALSIALPWEGVLVYAASKNLATLIGLTPGSLGVVELISIYLGTVLGYSTADALSVQALIRAVAIVSLLLLGPLALLYLRRRIGVNAPAQTGTADD
jgi:uncharacterized membrane protein YbhN (UPF0104 family)